jgi:hypothetical protein
MSQCISSTTTAKKDGFWDGDTAQIVEHLSNMYKGLGSIPGITKKKKEKTGLKLPRFSKAYKLTDSKKKPQNKTC